MEIGARRGPNSLTPLAAQTEAAQTEDSRSGAEVPVADPRGGETREIGSRMSGAGGEPKRISQPLIIGALLLFDLVVMPVAGYYSCRSVVGSAAMDPRLLACGLLTVTGAALFVLRARWSYTIRALENFPRQTVNLALALAAGMALWIGACVLADAVEPSILRPWCLRWFAAALGCGAFARALFAVAAARWVRQGRIARNTVIVGASAQGIETLRRLDKSRQGHLRILGLFDDRAGARLPPDLRVYPLLGSFDDLAAFCRERKVDLLIVAIPIGARKRLLHILAKLWDLPVDVRILADPGEIMLSPRAYNYIGDVAFLPAFDRPLSDWDRVIKSLFDRIVAAVLIVLAAPFLMALALGVKLSSPGPVLFLQTRDGFNNRKFSIYKFRSMYAELCDPGAERLVTRGDPRVTRFGAFMRRTSLDELPQLFNVLRGDLSLVGPRPHATHVPDGQSYAEAVKRYFARHRVKPGMTGWAQVRGWRGETDTLEKIEQRVAHDLYYIENWSIWFDLKILALTPYAVLFGKNAY